MQNLKRTKWDYDIEVTGWKLSSFNAANRNSDEEIKETVAELIVKELKRIKKPKWLKIKRRINRWT